MLGQCECIIILFSFDEAFLRYSNLSEDYSCKTWFRRYSTHVLNLTEIKWGRRVASESVWFSSFSWVWQKHLVQQKFDRVCQTFVELNLNSTHGVPSESDVVPVLLENRTYSVRFGTLKVRRLNQALLVFSFWQFWNQTPFRFKNTYFIYFLGLFLFWKFKLLCFQPTLFTALRSFV